MDTAWLKVPQQVAHVLLSVWQGLVSALHSCELASSSQQPYRVDTIVIFILQMRKLWHKKYKFTQLVNKFTGWKPQQRNNGIGLDAFHGSLLSEILQHNFLLVLNHFLLENHSPLELLGMMEKLSI